MDTSRSEEAEETEEYFETISNGSDDKNDDDNNVSEKDFALESEINVNQLRTSLKEIENEFRANIEGTNTSLMDMNNSTRRSYVHSKGKAPEPPHRNNFSQVTPSSLTQNEPYGRREPNIVKETQI